MKIFYANNDTRLNKAKEFSFIFPNIYLCVYSFEKLVFQYYIKYTYIELPNMYMLYIIISMN